MHPSSRRKGLLSEPTLTPKSSHPTSEALQGIVSCTEIHANTMEVVIWISRQTISSTAPSRAGEQLFDGGPAGP